MRSLGVIEDGSVLVVNGVISEVGPTRRVENLAAARSAEEINAAGRVVMPGFVDSHTHLVGAPVKAVQQSHRRTLVDALASAIQYVRNTPASTLQFSGRRHLELLLRHGTTTVEAKSGYGLSASAELKVLRVLSALDGELASVIPTFFGAHVLPAEFGTPDQYLSMLGTDVIPKLKDRRLAQFVDVLCDPAGFSMQHARSYLDPAKRLGFGIKIHADQAVRTGGTALAVEFGAASADGLNAIEDQDVEALARSSTVATLLPGLVHSRMYDRFPPARQLIDAGAAVALGSAFTPWLASTFNMQMVVSLACTHMDMQPEEAISAATINGAHALGRGGQSGSLEHGKDADVLVLDVSDYREIPMHFGCNIVASTMRKGQVVYREGALTCGGG